MGVFYFEEPKIRRKIGIRSIGYFSEISLSVSRMSINFWGFRLKKRSTFAERFRVKTK